MLANARRAASSLRGGRAGLEALATSTSTQMRELGGGVPEFWGRKSAYTEGTEFLGTPKNHMDLIGESEAQKESAQTRERCNDPAPRLVNRARVARLSPCPRTCGEWKDGALQLWKPGENFPIGRRKAPHLAGRLQHQRVSPLRLPDHSADVHRQPRFGRRPLW